MRGLKTIQQHNISHVKWTKYLFCFQGRSNAAKKAVLITDGPSNRDSYLTIPVAQQLRNIGADVVAVAVGPYVDQFELQVSSMCTYMQQKGLLVEEG